MRTKMFLAVFTLVLLLFLFGAPVKKLLCSAGWIENTNVGNLIEVEKVYDEGTFGAPLLNAAEQAKRDITDLYTNYIPFYVRITAFANTLKQKINEPVSTLLMTRGNEQLRLKREEEVQSILSEEPEKEPEPEVPDSPEETPEEPPEEKPAGEAPEPVRPEPDEEPEEKNEEPPAQEPTEKDPGSDPGMKAVYLSGDRRHHYYEITAGTDSSGTPIDFYVRLPAMEAEELRPAMEEQARRFNALSRTDGIHFYLFAVTCFEDTVLCDRLLPAESKYGLFRDFFARLNDGIQYAYLEVQTPEDKWTKYWCTDHHWNYNGWLEAHEKLFGLLQNNYPELEKRDHRTYVFDGCRMYGSNALAVSSYRFYDTFGVTLFDLPEHTFEIDTGVPYGGFETNEESLLHYTTGTWNTSESYNHYMNFFRIGKKIVYPENHTGRNLLLICDSYSPPLMEVLASYFDVTYLRYVDSNSDLSRCSLSDYADGLGVTDVIVLEISDRIVYDYYGDSLAELTGYEGGE